MDQMNSQAIDSSVFMEMSSLIVVDRIELADDVRVPYMAQIDSVEEIQFQNTGTCPDCAGGMIHQGGCSYCRDCGYESCGL